MSASGETFASWATRVTRCSNPTFYRVVNRLWDNPALQKDVLAVLTGVTKLIHSRGGRESAAEYYAALLSLLNNKTTTKTAEAYLLRLVVSKAVPVSLLRMTCSEVSKTITNVLSAALQEDLIDICLCKSLLLSLGRVLSVQPVEDWASESVRHTYRIFLRFIDYDNAALRKAVHKVICELLTFTISTEGAYHPACHQTINHVCNLIRQASTELSTLIRISDGECGRLLYALNLLKSVICVAPEKDIKLACECVLELTSVNNSLVLKSAFECLQTLFQGKFKAVTVPLDTAGKLMTALFTCKPRDSTSIDIVTLKKDSESLIAWIKCLSAGVGYLTSLAVGRHEESSTELANYVAVEHLEHLARVALSIVANSPLPGLRNSIRSLLVDVLLNQLTEQLEVCDLLTHRPRFLPDLCLTLQSALNLARRETWANLLNVSSHLMHAWAMKAVVRNSIDTQLPAEVIGLIQHVAGLRDALGDGVEDAVDDGVSVNVLVDEMDRMILTSLESWGIESVLRDALPLEPLVLELESGVVEMRRSWILPLIARVHPLHSCSLAFFYSEILPLADRAVTVAKAAAGQTFKRQIGGENGAPFVPLSAILNAAVQMARQLWITLTAFTRRAPSRWADLTDSGLGGRLIACLLTAKTVRPTILSALRRLVTFAKTEEAIAVMRSGAKQMVPKMLSMYEDQDSANDQQLKQQLESTLSVLLPLLTPKERLCSPFGQHHVFLNPTKMLSVPCEMAHKKLVGTKRPIYMEILMLILPNLTSENIKSVLGQLENYFVLKDPGCRALTKAAYRLLEAVLSSPNPSAKEFVAANLANLTSFMAQIAPLSTEVVEGAVTEIEPTDHLSTTMAALTLSAKERKALAIATPWKARLRILRHLLRAHAEKQGDQAEERCENAVQDFISTFMPEVPPCLGNLNSLVRILAGRLLVDMALATAGSLSWDVETLRTGSLRRFGSITAAPSNITRMDDDEGVEDAREMEEIEGIDEEGKNSNYDDDDETVSDHSYNPTEITSVCTSISITGVDPFIAMKNCAGLRNILAYLWPVIFEVSVENLKNSQSQSLRLEVATKSVCRLLSDFRLRRSLMTAMQEAADTKGNLDASEILSTANRAAHKLVQLPIKHIARLGLQISRLLIAFVGNSVYVSDIVVAIHQINESHKHSLRFMVKAMVEKLLKKVSVQALLSLMGPEYHKMIRNSAKILRRREQKGKTEGRKRGPKSTSGDIDLDDEVGTVFSEGSVRHPGSASSVSGASLKSLGSALSLSRPIHVQSIQEILAASDDEADEGGGGGGVTETMRHKPSSPPLKRLGLAAELERAASVAGLSRRSRRNLLVGSYGVNSDGDNEGFDDLATIRKVRFADDVAKLHLTGKKRNQRAATEDTSPSMTYLVEDADDEVVDLAEPESLARHLTVASSAQLAKRVLRPNVSASGVSAFKRARLTSLSSTPSFPTSIDGKFIINDSTVQDSKEPWPLIDADDDGVDDVRTCSMTRDTSVARAVAVTPKRTRALRLPGAEYRSARAEGDMKKPGRPDPFAYAPLGAGLDTINRRGISSGVATASERRALLRCLGAGKRKRKQEKRKKIRGVSAGFHQRKASSASSTNVMSRRQKARRIRE